MAIDPDDARRFHRTRPPTPRRTRRCRIRDRRASARSRSRPAGSRRCGSGGDGEADRRTARTPRACRRRRARRLPRASAAVRRRWTTARAARDTSGNVSSARCFASSAAIQWASRSSDGLTCVRRGRSPASEDPTCRRRNHLERFHPEIVHPGHIALDLGLRFGLVAAGSDLRLDLHLAVAAIAALPFSSTRWPTCFDRSSSVTRAYFIEPLVVVSM